MFVEIKKKRGGKPISGKCMICQVYARRLYPTSIKISIRYASADLECMYFCSECQRKYFKPLYDFFEETESKILNSINNRKTNEKQ